MSDGPKACPFCDGTPAMTRSGRVICMFCGVKATCIEAWNARFMPPEVKALVEAAEEILHHCPQAGTYPDGPCIEGWLRDELKAALAALDKAKGADTEQETNNPCDTPVCPRRNYKTCPEPCNLYRKWMEDGAALAKAKGGKP